MANNKFTRFVDKNNPHKKAVKAKKIKKGGCK